MSAFDGLPPKLREWLRVHRPGVKIVVPKGYTAKERAERVEKIRVAYLAGIAAGADPRRLVAGLAAEFQLEQTRVYEITIPLRGKETKIQEG